MTDDRDIAERLEQKAEVPYLPEIIRALIGEAAALIRELDKAVADVMTSHGIAVSTVTGNIIYAAAARHAARVKRSAGDE